MKRYLIFVAIGPFIGGFLMLFTTAYQSGYWTQTNLGEVGKLFVIFVKTLQYSYLFGIIPVLAIAAIDDILSHVRRIGWVTRADSSSERRPIRCHRVALWLARSGHRRGAVHPLWPCWPRARRCCRRG